MIELLKKLLINKITHLSISKIGALIFTGICFILVLKKDLRFQFTLNPPPQSAIEYTDFPVQEPQVLDALSFKKQNYLKIPNVAFHYADKVQIESFYREYFKEPVIEKQIREEELEKRQNGKAGIDGLLEAEGTSSQSEKRISTLRYTESTVNGMFLKYFKAMLNQNLVRIGLEELDIELENVSTFNRIVERLETEFDFKIASEIRQDHEAILKSQAAEMTIQMLQNARDWTVIKGDFLIQKEAAFYKLTLEHPVNYYLQGTEKVLISTLIPKDKIEPSFIANYQQSLNSKIPITLYGKVWKPIDLKNKHFELMITPLAVF